MKKIILALAGAGVMLSGVAAVAGPAEDQSKVVKYLTEKYPDIKLDQYIHGALAFSPDAKSQYDSIMDFPPFLGVIEAGQKMWETPFKNGKTYASCMPNGGKMIAGNYPMFDEAKGKVVTFEDEINNCRTKNGEEAYKVADPKTMGTLVSYARGLSDGMKMNIQVNSPAAQKAYEEGKKTYYARAGQLNFSCANCHVDNAAVNLRSELLSPGVGQATHWPVFRGKDDGVVPTTLQGRYEGCFKQVRHVPDKAGSTRMNNLEYFHSALSNGLEMKASVYRK